MEDVVAREYDSIKPSIQGFCGCELCREDVLVYSLNRIQPRYVTQLTGQIITDRSLSSDQERARISVVLVEAFGVVQQTPRTGHP